MGIYIKYYQMYRNPSLALTTKARVYKGAGQEWSPRVKFHPRKSVGEREGMNSHTPKWIPTLRIEVPMDSWIFIGQLQGLKFIGLKIFYIIGNILERKCLKWVRMIHLDT